MRGVGGDHGDLSGLEAGGERLLDVPRDEPRLFGIAAALAVGLKLFIIGDGRWKAQNFPTYSVDPGQLVWDFAAGRSNYTTLRENGAKAFDQRAWDLESSIDVSAVTLPPPEPIVPIPTPPDAGPATDTGPADTGPIDTGASDTAPTDTATPATDAPGTDGASDGSSDADEAATDAPATPDAATDATPATDAPAPKDTGSPADVGTPPGVSPTATDVEIAFGTYSQRRVTRLRADLPVRHLSTDLVLEADTNQSPLPVANRATRWTNETSVCPTGTLRLIGSAPGTLLGKSAAACAMPSETTSTAAIPVGIFGALAAIGIVRRRRR